MKRQRHAIRQIPALSEPLEVRRLLATIASVTPTNGLQKVAVNTNVVVNFVDALNVSTMTSANFRLRDAAGAVVPATLSYTASTNSVTINPTQTLLQSNGYYSVTVAGGASGVQDAFNVPLAKDYTFSFTTGTPQFSETVVASGLNQPTNVEFAADGRMFVAEKRGVIDVYDSITDTTPKVFADLRTEVHNYWDRGLLGLALDPKFDSGRPYVYALYTYDADIGGTAPKYGTPNGDGDAGGPSPTGTGSTVSCRLVKLTASGDTMTNEQVLINDWPDQFPSHSIGDLRFGPDGYLYASGGDGASFNFADYGQVGNPFHDPVNAGGALRSQDALSPNDPTELNGSIIRIDPDTGLGAPGNPLTGGDANRSRIIAFGLRNPFRLTFRPGTNELWVDDTGWNTWEEINRIPDTTENFAPNFGWPAYEGPNPQPAYQALNLPLLAPLYANPKLVTSPYFTYQHSDHIVPGGSDPTGASSSTGLAFYNGGTYPAAYNGALFFADYSRAEIYVMYAGPTGLPDVNTRQIFPTSTVGAVDLKIGPGGDLFYIDLNAGRIVRVSANVSHAPQAVITSDKAVGLLPLTIKFSAGASTDPDAGDTLTYAWDLDGDGNFNDSTALSPSYTYTTAGPRTVQLRVTDSTGLYSVATLHILPGNSAPVPVITTPTTALHWKVGDTITFAGTATDAEDGALPASSLTWNAVLVYGSTDDPAAHQDRPLQQFTGVSGGSFTAPDWDYPAWVEIRMNATDSAGTSTTSILRIDPLVSKISLASNVAGVPISLDGTSYVTPGSKTVLVSSSNTLSAPATYVSGDTTYNFVGWSDGGALSHLFKALTADTTYTANYVAAPPTVIAPSGLTATASASGSTEAVLTWNDNSTNETSFVIERSTTAAFTVIDAARTAAANTNTYYDWGLQRNVQYYYRIRAIDGAYASPNSNTASLTLPPTPAGVPAMPSGFTAKASPGSTSEIALAWTDNATNETGFTIQRSLTATFATIDATLSPVADSTIYYDWGLKAGTTYYYRIRSINGSSSSAWTATVTYVPASSTTAPAAPSALTATASGTSNSEIVLKWSDVTALADYYVLERSTTAAFTTFTTVGESTYTGPYYDWGLLPSTTYYYRVKGVNAAGTSAYSAIVSGKTTA